MMEKVKNEKVKLPKEICGLLDELFEEKNSLGDDTKYYIIWYCLQVPTYIYLDKKYIELNEFSNKVTNTEKIVNAILYGYDQEEKEEERKEREIKEKMKKYVESYKSNCAKTEDYVSELYDIARGKK